MIQVPELTLKTIIDSILAKIKSNYVDASDKNTTYLYKLFGTNAVGNYNMFDQAVKILNRNIDDPRTIDTRLLFDRERASLPTIHVTLPAEQPSGDGVGFDEGYQESEYDPYTPPAQPTSFTEYYTRGYNSKFELIITGSNTFEVLMIYYTLKTALISNIDSLEYNGFRNPKIYGGDLRINEQISPPMYLRVLNLDSFVELSIPKFDSISIMTSANFSGTAYE